VKPSLSLRSGAAQLGWQREWASGGRLQASLRPVEKDLALDWTDASSSGHGAWRARARVPLEDAARGSTVSVTRDWNY
jgi:hypothetical protein